jgi:pyridoxamine 5'-phosphate oxidase
MNNSAEWKVPFERFSALFEQAKLAQPKDPNQMWLATVSDEGWPEVRVVLLKDFDTTGFVFFTNYRSTKGQHLTHTAKAALNFYWPALDTQIRIQGVTHQVSGAESDAYFSSRPLDSRLGAWASHQSDVLASRSELEDRLDKLREQFRDGAVPRPPHWGGFRLVPRKIEFWKAHPFRLHYREVYVQSGQRWTHHWLNP